MLSHDFRNRYEAENSFAVGESLKKQSVRILSNRRLSTHFGSIDTFKGTLAAIQGDCLLLRNGRPAVQLRRIKSIVSSNLTPMTSLPTHQLWERRIQRKNNNQWFSITKRRLIRCRINSRSLRFRERTEEKAKLGS